jgi:hypothetical protein
MPSPKSAKTSVIKFPAKSSGAGRRSRVGKRPDRPDADLIEHCIEYAMQISAGRVAYMVDPTDAKFASYCDDLAQSRADRAMNAILDIEAVTIDGVRAKAALVKLSIEDWDGDLDELRQSFLISLADDMIRIQRHARGLNQHLDPIVVPK